MLKPGTYLNRRYEIVKRIGTGGMADVYRGKDHKLRRYVAIKVLKNEFAEDVSFVKNFQIEAQAAAGMLHSNVVNVYDVGEDSGYNFMVMELVDGNTLKDVIEEKGQLSDKETISIAIQMAAGLEAAHNKKLVHRDVKPQNVMLSKDGKVKVTDFGIAKPTTSNTISTDVLGSVHYTSPEQARGGKCDIQSDIYSMGITMYEMIAGVVPFDGEATVNVALKHIQEEITPPSEYAPDMYYSLEQIILKCTQKNPEFRYENMSMLMLDLKRSLIHPDGDFVVIDTGDFSESSQISLANNSLGYVGSEEFQEFDELDSDDYEEEGDQDYTIGYDLDDDDSDYDTLDGEEYDEYSGREAQDELDPKMHKIAKVLTAIIAVIVIATIIFISVQAINYFRMGPGGSAHVEDEQNQVRMPNLIGKTEDQAKEILKKYELGYYKKGEEPSSQYEAGLVIQQEIESGTMVDKNITVNVVLSSGISKATIQVPNLIGMTEERAQQALNQLNLKMESKTEYSEEYDQGIVCSVEPKEGTTVAEESSVVVVISMGKEVVKVPNLLNKKAEDAEKILQEAKLVGKSKEEYSNTVEAGLVISQGTKEGTEVTVGTEITYVISKGKKELVMPSVVGKTEDQVVEELEGMGVYVNVKEEYSNTVSERYVIRADVNAGNKISVGSTVTVVVSIGKKPVAPVIPTPDGNTGGGNTGGGDTGGGNTGGGNTGGGNTGGEGTEGGNTGGEGTEGGDTGGEGTEGGDTGGGNTGGENPGEQGQGTQPNPIGNNTSPTPTTEDELNNSNGSNN